MTITSDELQDEYARLMFSDKRVVDESAFDTKQVAKNFGVSWSQGSKRARTKVETGEWEQVWKHDENGKLIKAYRPKR